MDREERQHQDDEARAEERREWETQLLLTMATLRHRDAGIEFENLNLFGGVPLGKLRYRVEVDRVLFWQTYNELKERKGWR